MRECQFCSHIVSSDDRYCVYCGKLVEHSRKRRITRNLIVRFMLVLLALIYLLNPQPFISLWDTFMSFVNISDSSQQRNAQPNNTTKITQTPKQAKASLSPTAQVTKLVVDEYEASSDDNGECVICVIEDWEEPTKPGDYTWELEFPANKRALLQLGWCALNEQILYHNLEYMEYHLYLGEFEVELDETSGYRSSSTENGECLYRAVILEGWSKGDHLYEWKHVITRDVHDGWRNFSAGTYRMTFIVHVQ